MFYPKTGELETHWTNYHCTEEDCPGKDRKRSLDHSYAMKMREWIGLSEGGRKRKRLPTEGMEDDDR